MFNECFKYRIKTRLDFTSSFVDQNNPRSKYWCKNELIYIRDFEAVQKTHSRMLFLNLIIHSCSFFKQCSMFGSFLL